MNNMEGMELARAYIRIQPYGMIYQSAEGLVKGTIFPDLYVPYNGRNKENQRKEVYTGSRRGFLRG